MNKEPKYKTHSRLFFNLHLPNATVALNPEPLEPAI
jgi:hypothetical protein